MKNSIIPLLLLLVLTSCNQPCCNYQVVGVNEFVCDSYKIREGKGAIQEMMGVAFGELPHDAMTEYRDEIADDDVLTIALYHPKREDVRKNIEYINTTMGGFRVTNGAVSFPDIPAINVAGLTLEEAKQKLQENFREHYSDAEIFITYKNRLRNRVELSGRVGVNSIPVDGKLRLYELLSQAKIDPGANLYMSYVMRNGEQLPIDIYRLLHDGDMSRNIVMKGGDRIFIANGSDATVMMMGEVGSPSAVSVPYGFITLPEAIVAARGIPYTGDRRNIQIIRGDLQCPKIYVLSWNHIVNLPNDSMLLMPGDTVFVSEKPITKWNRFISQIFPSCQAVHTFRGVYDLFN